MWSNFDNSIHNTSGAGLNDSLSSASGSAGSGKRGENVFPVMIHHLINSHNDLVIWGISVHTVTLVGIVRNIEHSATKATYEVEDETGRITAFRWLESDHQVEKFVPNVNSYVRIYGRLREQSGKKHVLILKMYPLMDLNELTNHLLEVINIMKSMENMRNTESNNVENMDITTDHNLSGLNKEQSLVFKIIQAENDTVNGINKDVLKRRVPKNIVSIMDDIIDFLTSEGHIYTTITDNHFKTT